MRTIKIAALGLLAIVTAACGGTDRHSNAPRSSASEATFQDTQTADSLAEAPATETVTDESFAGMSDAPSASASTAPPAPLAGEANVDEALTSMIGVELEDSLAIECKVPLAETYFEYDSATLRPLASNMLHNLANCLNSTELRGRQITLTGHADPRGSDEYNRKLGKSRAQAVADFLAERGVTRARMRVVTQGEQRAAAGAGNHLFDRRVAIRLVPLDR